jgi:pyruvyltransferase
MYKVFWSNSHPNFGDILTPYILDHHNIKYEMDDVAAKGSAMCIGSIIHKATDNMIVLGSGCMHSKHQLNPNADYRFVRGPLTRQRVLECGGTCPSIYGDPALLLPEFCSESKKEYDVGIVPHYVDYADIVERYPNYKVIDLTNNDPIAVAKEITKCRSIISTSLHGIIAAHAYGIPAAWVKYSNKLKGNDIKFRDYYSSVQCTDYFKPYNNIEQVEFCTPVLPDLQKIKEKFLELND